jgi:hypothetical protein
MVNGWLRSWPPAASHPGQWIALEESIRRIFATNAALTNQINAVGKPRSHFGPADSWVIKTSGTAVSAVGC